MHLKRSCSKGHRFVQAAMYQVTFRRSSIGCLQLTLFGRRHWVISIWCFPRIVGEGPGRSLLFLDKIETLQWRHNEGDGVSKHQRLDCLATYQISFWSLFLRLSTPEKMYAYLFALVTESHWNVKCLVIRMMTLSNGNIFRATGHLCGELVPPQRPVTRSLDVFFDLRLIKRLSKQSQGWWCEMPSHPL